MEKLSKNQDAPERASTNPELPLSSLGEASLEKLRRREDAITERVSRSGNPELIRRMYTLLRESRKKVTLAIGAAALLSSSLSYAHDNVSVEKISNATTLEEYNGTTLPTINVSDIEAVVSGVQTFAEDRLSKLTTGVSKLVTGETLSEKVDGFAQASGTLPGRFGEVERIVQYGKKISDDKTVTGDKVEAGGKLLEMAGGKLGPLGALLANGADLQKDIAEGKSGKEIAFKFLKLLIAAKTAGLSNLLAKTLIDLSERTTPTLTLHDASGPQGHEDRF